METKKVETKKVDVVIVGGGVAGITAAVYAKRRGLNVAVVEKYALGGQVNSIVRIENFPSQSSIDGITLCQMFAEQVKKHEIDVIFDEVLECDLASTEKTILCRKHKFVCKAVILATGLSYVKLGIGEEKWLGRGVSFCAVCDAYFHKGENVCVASKSGSGIKAALELSRVCNHVTILDEGNLSVYAAANKNEKIDVVSNVEIVSVGGEGKLSSLTIKVDGKEKMFKTDALFVELGKTPHSNLLKGLKLDANGYVETDEKMQTSVDGVFAVGDVRAKDLRQIVTACSDGAIAGQNC